MPDYKNGNKGYSPRGERGGFGSKRSGEERRGSFGGKSYGEKKSFGDKPYGGKPYGDKKPYGSKPYGEKRSFGDRPYGEKRSYGEKKPYGEKVFGSKPYGDKPFGAKSFGRPAPMPRVRVGSGRPAPMPAVRPVRPARVVEEQDAPAENILAGRNPIREAIMAGHAIEKLLVARGLTGSALEIIARARQAGIVVQEVERVRLDGIYPNHQGMVAYASAAEYTTLEELLKIPAQRGEDPFFVVLDGVTDPHNLGAILRSAAAAGAHGVIVPERRAAGLVPAAVKASAGALEHIAVAKVGNLRQALETLKENGVWLIAAAADGETVYDADLTGPAALVIGSEGDGVSPLIRTTCDRVVSLPMENGMESLNASVAAGILLYEIRRARKAL